MKNLLTAGFDAASTKLIMEQLLNAANVVAKKYGMKVVVKKGNFDTMTFSPELTFHLPAIEKKRTPAKPVKPAAKKFDTRGFDKLLLALSEIKLDGIGTVKSKLEDQQIVVRFKSDVLDTVKSKLTKRIEKIVATVPSATIEIFKNRVVVSF